MHATTSDIALLGLALPKEPADSLHPRFPRSRNGMSLSSPDQVEQETARFSLVVIWRRVKRNIEQNANWLVFLGCFYPPPPLPAQRQCFLGMTVRWEPLTDDLILMKCGCREWVSERAYIMAVIWVRSDGS
jgi:hypothetical protein